MAGTSGKRVGAINVGVFAQTRKFVKQMSVARRTVGKFVKSIKGMLFNIKTLGVALSAGIFAKFIKDSFVAIDALAKTSDKLGITTEALAGLRVAAEESGVAANTLDMGLQRMVRRISEAAIGTGEAQTALRELRLDAVALNQLAPDQQFFAIAKAMERVGLQSDRVRLSMRLFDSEGVALVNTLNLGQKGLQEVTDFAVKAGLAVDRKMARSIERANAAFGRMRLVIRGIFNQIAIEMGPYVEGVSKALTSLGIANGRAQTIGKSIGAFIVEFFLNLGNQFQKAIAAFIRLIATLNDMIIQFRKGPVSRSLGLGFKGEGVGQDLNRMFVGAPQLRGKASPERQAMQSFSAQLRQTADNFTQRSFREIVKSFMTNVNTGDQKDLLTPGRVLGRIEDLLRRAVGPTVANARQLGGDALGALGQGRSSFVMAALKSLFNAPVNQQTGPSRNSLGLARSSSSEGFRQRVAALRGTNDVPKKQLKEQEKIRIATETTAIAIGGIAGNLGVAQEM